MTNEKEMCLACGCPDVFHSIGLMTGDIFHLCKECVDGALLDKFESIPSINNPTKVYKYEELSDEAKEVARQWFSESVFDHEWWESAYDDAKAIGIKIEGFDLDRNKHCKGRFIETDTETANLILGDHGPDCATYLLTKQYLKDLKGIDSEYKEHDLATEFLRALLEEYATRLQEESDWMLSEEYLEEGISCNEYEFTEDGKVF